MAGQKSSLTGQCLRSPLQTGPAHRDTCEGGETAGGLTSDQGACPWDLDLQLPSVTLLQTSVTLQPPSVTLQLPLAVLEPPLVCLQVPCNVCLNNEPIPGRPEFLSEKASCHRGTAGAVLCFFLVCVSDNCVLSWVAFECPFPPEKERLATVVSLRVNQFYEPRSEPRLRSLDSPVKLVFRRPRHTLLVCHLIVSDRTCKRAGACTGGVRTGVPLCPWG